jgi:hypothetical protein
MSDQTISFLTAEFIENRLSGALKFGLVTQKFPHSTVRERRFWLIVFMTSR